ncbi:IS110 family transposase [Streptomyces bacillaris]|uniref:IS110 family transposase n=1 Tax=Streptomyces bacillaris TaxID=68179 RepID=UPI0037F9061E
MGEKGASVPRWWAGIDWSERLQDCAIVDERGDVVRHLRIEESLDGLDEFLTALRDLNRRSHRHSARQVPCAIEDGNRLLAVELRRRGQQVIVIPPAVSARHRGRTGTAVSKADRTDAALLANIIRTQTPGQFRPMPDVSDQAQAIRVLARAAVEATEERRRAVISLRAHLMRYYPAYVRAWEPYHLGLRRAEARALLALAPTPAQAAALRPRKIAKVLEGAGRFRLVEDTAAEIRDRLAVLDLRQPPATEAAMGEQTVLLVQQLDAVCARVEHLTRRANDAFDAHPQSAIYRSFPVFGSLLAVRVFAEIGDDADRFGSGRRLRAYAGVAPLTWSSSTSHAVTFRRAANTALRTAVMRWAFGCLTRSPGCRARYDERRERGDRYAAALRIVAGRLLSGLHHCLATGQLYDEATMWSRAAESDLRVRREPGADRAGGGIRCLESPPGPEPSSGGGTPPPAP